MPTSSIFIKTISVRLESIASVRPPAHHFRSSRNSGQHASGPPRPKSANNGSRSYFMPHRRGRSRTQIASPELLALACPSKASYHTLSGKNGADLFCRSNSQLITFQLEKSYLVLSGEKLIPRYVHFGCKL